MYELKVVTRFAAAHRLTMVGEKCEHLHGHNWKIEACVTGEDLDKGGVLLDFGRIKSHVRDIMGLVDHRFLNELEWFTEETPPSSEHIARFVAQRLQQRLESTGVRVSRVSAWESYDACATYDP